jgi:hypothetical protein
MPVTHSSTARPQQGIAKRKKRKPSPLQKAIILDKKESTRRLRIKTSEAKKRWGNNWKDMVRTGRRYTRVQRIDPVTADANVTYVLRPEPGWEWICQNCKTYSLIRESDMPGILEEWEILAYKTLNAGFKPPEKPTAATAGCPNCKFRPGAPE